MRLPVLGVGGVASGADALQYILAGASLVGVGTAALRDPRAPERIVRELDGMVHDTRRDATFRRCAERWSGRRVTPTPIVALDVPHGAPRRSTSSTTSATAARSTRSATSCSPPRDRRSCARCASAARDVFLDLKFHDIPNTVAGGVRNAAALGARLVTVHATGGRRDARGRGARPRGTSCGVLAVTVLTSLDAARDRRRVGTRRSVDVGDEVLRLAEIAARRGRARGRVQRARGARGDGRVRRPARGAGAGVRAAGGATQDQARVVTPREAEDAGARYVIIGRMVTAAPDRRAAMDAVLAELSLAGVTRRGGDTARRRISSELGPLLEVTAAQLLLGSGREFFGRFLPFSESSRSACESSHQREADLRALQSCEAQRRDSHHLQAQPQA